MDSHEILYKHSGFPNDVCFNNFDDFLIIISINCEVQWNAKHHYMVIITC